MSLSRGVAIVVVMSASFAATLLRPHALAARPLDAEICKNLTTQRDELEARGVRQLAAAGPAGRTLTARQLADVRQFLDLEGQLRFRCPFDQVLAPLKEDVPDEPDPAPAAGPGEEPARNAPVAKSGEGTKKRPAPPKSRPDAKSGAAAAPASSDPKAAQAAPKSTTAPVARPAAKRTDDAYRPPSPGSGGSSTLDSQAKQVK